MNILIVLGLWGFLALCVMTVVRYVVKVAVNVALREYEVERNGSHRDAA